MSAPPGHSMVFRKLQKGGLTYLQHENQGKTGKLGWLRYGDGDSNRGLMAENHPRVL